MMLLQILVSDLQSEMREQHARITQLERVMGEWSRVHASVQCKQRKPLIDIVFDLINTDKLLDNVTQKSFLI